MRPMRPTTRWLALALVLVAVGASSMWLGLWSRYGFNRTCPDTPLVKGIVAAVLQLAGFLSFHSDACQDRWIVLEVYPGLRTGFFVDLGSGDGEAKSNTKVLEDLGWNGVCIDPFPTNMSGRRCTLFTVPVDSVSGKRVRFRKAGVLGGIEELLGRGKASTLTARVVELETRTLTELLAQAKAPPFIHYMSIDIEGAELEALKGLDFSRYRIGALTVEHNLEEPKRSEIRRLLERNGYRLVRTVEQDDFYVGAE
jgi:methyltransferase FkbM-like protein